MLSIPEPLHPAVVHFPIALLLVGAGLSLLAVIFRRWALPTALVLALGAAGAVVAVRTGEYEEHRLPKTTGELHEAFENHEHAGKRTRNFALVATVFAILSVLPLRMPIVRRVLAGITAVVALMSAYQVAQTGHYGGTLVYKFGLGIEKSALSKKP